MMTETPAGLPSGDQQRNVDQEWEMLRAELAAAFRAPGAEPSPAHTTRKGRPQSNARRKKQDIPGSEPDKDNGTRLTVKTRRYFRDTVVAAQGDLDKDTAALLRRALTEAMREPEGARLLAADLRSARITADDAWSVLIDTHRRLADTGRRLFIVLSPDDPATRRMTALGLDTLLTRVSKPADLKRLG